jgi:hypothetical protein
MSRSLLDRWLDYELAGCSVRNLMILVGRKYSCAVDRLPAPAEEVLPAFCLSAREGLGALQTRSCGESARETRRNLLTLEATCLIDTHEQFSLTSSANLSPLNSVVQKAVSLCLATHPLFGPCSPLPRFLPLVSVLPSFRPVVGIIAAVSL